MVLTTLPLWLSGLILVGLTTFLAMAGVVIVRHYVSLDRLRTNNEVAGFKFATIGVLYAVLLAFAVIVVWEKFNDAEKVIAQEAGAATTIYRLSNGIGAEPGAALRTAITSYLNAAIARDWPTMEHAEASLDVTHALDDAYAAVFRFRAADNREAALFAEILHELSLVTQARRARLALASGIVPGIVWAVLFGGAALTIGFTFFFGTDNLLAQTMMTGALAILISFALLATIAIDKPFAGTVKVGPEALSEVIKEFGGGSRP